MVISFLHGIHARRAERCCHSLRGLIVFLLWDPPPVAQFRHDLEGKFCQNAGTISKPIQLSATFYEQLTTLVVVSRIQFSLCFSLYHFRAVASCWSFRMFVKFVSRSFRRYQPCGGTLNRKHIFREFSQTKSFYNCPHQTYPTDYSSVDSQAKNLKAFDLIPGPKSLPLIGNIWRYAIGETSPYISFT